MRSVNFSIIIAVYNASLTIKQAVESVLQQTYTNFEIILINDGSQDNSGDICCELGRMDNRIRYIEFPCNLGLSHVRNHGILSAQGEYLGFLDADDILELNALAVCADNLKNKPADILVCGFFEEYRTTNKKEPFRLCKLPGHGFYSSPDDISDAVLEMIRSSSFCYTWNKLYKRRFLIEQGITFQKYPYIEDILMNLEAFARCSSVILMNVPLYHYNRGVQFSLTTRFEPNFLRLHQYLMDKEVTYFSAANHLKQAMSVLTCQYLKLVFTALQMTFYKGAPAGIMKVLLMETFQYPHHKLFMSFVHQLPLKYQLLGLILNFHSPKIIRGVSYCIYVAKHKLIRLWCAVK